MEVNKANLKEIKCRNIYVHEANSVKRANHPFALKGPVRETDIATMLRRMYETDFTEPRLQPLTSSSNFKEFSFNDARLMELMDREIKYSWSLPASTTCEESKVGTSKQSDYA